MNPTPVAAGFPLIILLAVVAGIVVMLGIWIISKFMSGSKDEREQRQYEAEAVPPSQGRDEGRKTLHLDKDRAMCAGVCSGLALRYDWDPSIVRLVFAAAFFLGIGTSLVAYVILWAIVPNLRTV